MTIKWRYGNQVYEPDTSGLVKPEVIDISKDRDFDLSKRILGKRLRELKRENPEKLMELLGSLSEEEADALLNDPMVLARDKQLIAFDSPYTIYLLCAGRGFGKTFTIAANIRRAIEHYGMKRITVIAKASRDIRSTIVPAIERSYSKNHPNKPTYSPSKTTMLYPSGAQILFISSESGADSVRGSEAELLIVDELAFLYEPESIMEQAMLTVRLGMSKVIVCTTPKANQPLINWIKRGKDKDDDYVGLISGATTDNFDNLSKSFRETTIEKYAGTSLWKTEILGELILENEAALFQYSTIQRNMFDAEKEYPNITTIAIGCDPAISSKGTASSKRSPDNTGIVVSGIDENGILYVLEDLTLSSTVEKWVNKVIDVYDKYSQLYPTVIMVESNVAGKELLSSAFDKARRGFHNNIKFQFSTASKLQRAMPFALLAEQNKVKFASEGLTDLIDEMVSYEGKGRSPDRLDAMVFSLTCLKPHRRKVGVVKELLM